MHTEALTKKQNLLKKKILYKSSKRGLKEMDILLGNFVKCKLDHFTAKELIMLDNLLDMPDIEIFRHLTKKDFHKLELDNKILKMIIDFYNEC